MKTLIIIIVCLVAGYLFAGGNIGDWYRDIKVNTAEIIAESKEVIAEKTPDIVDIKAESNIIKRWKGTGSRTLTYTVGQVPLKMRATYSSTGQPSRPFNVSIDRVIMSGLTQTYMDNTIYETGEYQFAVDAAGYTWEVTLIKI